MVDGPRVGEEFAGYRIERLLGRGGMGVVYLAQHVRLGRRAALKVLAPEVAEQEGFQERFVRESRLAASLDHPNIVPVYDAGEQDGTLYIAMRYVEGTDLANVIDGEPDGLDPGRSISILAQIAEALDAAHAEGLVHRDVKPGNILIGAPSSTGGREWGYLTDFGLTKQLTGGSRLTRTGVFMGTLQYVAPEQIRGEGLDGRADQYALACVLFEALVGEPPFLRDADLAVLSAHLTEPPPSLAAIRPHLRPSIDTVVARGMAKVPSERFETCGELIASARAAIEPDVRRSGPPDAATLPSAPVRMPDTKPVVTGTPPSTGRRRSKARWVAVAAVVVAAAVTGLVISNRGGGSTGTTDTAGTDLFRIAFSAETPSGSAIYVANSDGTEVTQLTDGRDEDLSPAISPDSKEIVFVRARSGGLQLMRIDADGTNVDPLIPGVQRDIIEPSWSREGTKLAAAASDGGIVVMNADGSGFVQITFGSTDAHPTWSPDGSQIAFERDFGIAIVNEDGTGLTVLSRGDDRVQPAWSPDGSKIAFAGLRDDIFLMNIDGSGVERLTKGPGFNEQPAWSPDGTKIVFSSSRGSAVQACAESCPTDLFIMDVDGTHVAPIFDEPFGGVGPSTSAI